MKFLRQKTEGKVVLSVSDLHLGAGPFVGERDNLLEEFHRDHEFALLLEHFSTGPYYSKRVELVINGDFLDFLAVPYVEVFEDQYWGQRASLKRLALMYQGHKTVFEGLINFLKQPDKTIVYLLGNHDGELILPSVLEQFYNYFPPELRSQICILSHSNAEYRPLPEIVFKHGHEYEMANYRNSDEAILQGTDGELHYNPPWGSYYVVRVINKFKVVNPHIQSVRPIKKFIIHGMIYDTLNTLRFILANLAYFFMVRFIYLFKSRRKFKDLIRYVREELVMFRNDHQIIEDYFDNNDEVKALVVGHSHGLLYKQFWSGPLFINTGTWMQMHNLDFGRPVSSQAMPFALIVVSDHDSNQSMVELGLYHWHGRASNAPYVSYATLA
ncbi:MAG: metallophosphoesterase [Bdellovibrio sp.]|nr:metallophosphoesterase [Bdellovibrio sp.]